MEFLTAGFKIFEQEPGKNGIYKQIEYPGRICYNSIQRIKEGSAEPFVKGLIKSNHTAPLEHGTVYLTIPFLNDFDDNFLHETPFTNNPYSKTIIDYKDKCSYITTNYRVIIENNLQKWMDRFMVEIPTKHERRVSVLFTVDRFTGEEFLRHRKGSFNRESTRYVTFTKEQFGAGSIKFIIPVWLLEDKPAINSYKDQPFEIYCKSVLDISNNKDGNKFMNDILVWMTALKGCEWAYNKLVNEHNWSAEQARTVLPCAISSPLYMTGFVSDWKHFFNLRAIGTTGKPHPQAKELALPLMDEFKKQNLL